MGFDSDRGRSGGGGLFLGVVLRREDREKERERRAREHRRNSDLQSEKEKRGLLGCQWKLEVLERAKGRFTLMGKAIAPQLESCRTSVLFSSGLHEARPAVVPATGQ